MTTKKTPPPPPTRFIPGRARDNRQPNHWCVFDRQTGVGYGAAFTGLTAKHECQALCDALNAHPDVWRLT